MKKPTYNWRVLLLSMSPGVEYNYTQMARKVAATDADRISPNAAQMMAVIRACGVYLQVNRCGNYLLTEKGVNFVNSNT
jgi:hypothetical protein